MISELPLYLLPLIFIVALLYASVGHGGASGYLALMGIAGMSLVAAKPAALILNCMVSIIAFAQYYRSGYFNSKLFLTLALASVPFAYLGGTLTLDDLLYKRILGAVLLISALRFLVPMNENEKTIAPSVTLLILSGAVIGFLSGLIGIGGGIILTPLLLLCKWTTLKTSACVSALFIFVNSLSGLLAQVKKGVDFDPEMFLVILIATAGGLIGSYYGARKWDISFLKKVLSLVLIIASLKLIFI